MNEMAKIETCFSCDLCGRTCTKYSEVRGSLSLDTGTRLVLVSDVCNKCAEKALEGIVQSFPKMFAINKQA